MIHVGRCVIGPGQPTFIIAEIGSNWHTIEDCFKSIEVAKRCGANAVKFQAFTFKSLYGLEKSFMPMAYNKNYELPIEWLPQLKNKCDQQGIEFMCTAFDPDTLRAIDPYVNAHKIASSDIGYVELLQMAARLRKPVIISCGAANEREIVVALAHLSGLQVALLYCVSAYPAVSVNLFVIDELKKIIPMVGYSDHTLDPLYIPLSAVKNHGAMVIEKHLSCVGKDTPDAFHSLNDVDFSKMVAFLRGEIATSIGPLDIELDMQFKHKRRLIATKEIKEGGRFVLGENYGSYRSLASDVAGLSSHMSREVDGKVARIKIEPGDPVTKGHVPL